MIKVTRKKKKNINVRVEDQFNECKIEYINKAYKEKSSKYLCLIQQFVVVP